LPIDAREVTSLLIRVVVFADAEKQRVADAAGGMAIQDVGVKQAFEYSRRKKRREFGV
jgi:hypothetical protein